MKPLSDNEAYELLMAAREALGDAPAETPYSDSALTAVRKLLEHSAKAILASAEIEADVRDGIFKDPSAP